MGKAGVLQGVGTEVRCLQVQVGEMNKLFMGCAVLGSWCFTLGQILGLKKMENGPYLGPDNKNGLAWA